MAMDVAFFCLSCFCLLFFLFSLICVLCSFCFFACLLRTRARAKRACAREARALARSARSLGLLHASTRLCRLYSTRLPLLSEAAFTQQGSLYPTRQPLLNKATVTPRGSLYSTRLDTSTRTQPKASQTSVLWLRLTRNPISNLKHKTRPYQKQSWAMIHGSQAPSSFHLFQFGLHWRLCFLLHQRLVLDQIRTVLCNCDLQLWHPLHNVAWQ